MCEQATAVHPFERAGLGKAPFRYVGMRAQEIMYGEAVIGRVGGVAITTKPGGTCDYCGQYIVNMFRVRSADGKEFKVGCDCIAKVDARLEKAIKPDVKKMKAARDDARIAAAVARLAEATSLHARPHPNKSLADRGRTLWEYCEWMFRNAGRTGRLDAARIVERALKGK